jgi:ATP-binding cassette subfamily F protein 3
VLDAVADRIVAIEDRRLRSYPGGWADYVRIRADEDAPPPPPPKEPRQAKPKPVKAAKPRPTELERLEAAIGTREAELAELERKLADDWGDVDTLAAHKAARDDLQSLLARWEQLFESAQQV